MLVHGKIQSGKSSPLETFSYHMLKSLIWGIPLATLNDMVVFFFIYIYIVISVFTISVYHLELGNPRFLGPNLERVSCYDHLNFLRASVVEFRASRYITRLNLTSVWKVMTIWISYELPLFNFDRLDILRAWIWSLC